MKEDKYYQELEAKDYYNTIDKRSKDYREYKQWKSYKKLQDNVDKDNKVGLGDVVEKITKATGIKKVVEAVTDDCGCDERKEKFNKFLSWKKRNVNCIKPDDYTWLKKYLSSRPTRHTYEDREKFIGIYNDIFNAKIKNTTCGSCLKSYLESLSKYLAVYDN